MSLVLVYIARGVRFFCRLFLGVRVDAPAGLKASGRALWDGVAAVRDVRPEYVSLLLNACRIADRLDDLSAGDMPLTVENARGDEVANPVFTEHRQQLSTLKAVLASLGVDKLPVAEVEEVPFEERLAQAAAALKNPELRVIR